MFAESRHPGATLDAHKHPYQISDLASLEKLYGMPAQAAIKKEIPYLHPHYRAFIEAAPFAVLATSGPEGLDASPRGDPPGFIKVQDPKTLLLPDRRGNNRIDSLRNILCDPRIALIFMIPGVGETLRVNGHARILVDPDLLKRFSLDGNAPRSVLEIQVETVYFQCSSAILRSGLWNACSQFDRSALPSTGVILQGGGAGGGGGGGGGRGGPERRKAT